MYLIFIDIVISQQFVVVFCRYPLSPLSIASVCKFQLSFRVVGGDRGYLVSDTHTHKTFLNIHFVKYFSVITRILIQIKTSNFPHLFFLLTFFLPPFQGYLHNHKFSHRALPYAINLRPFRAYYRLLFL